MPKRTAVLLDGGFVQKRLYSLKGKKPAKARDILTFAAKIGLDVAWLASKRIVDRIVLVTRIRTSCRQ